MAVAKIKATPPIFSRRIALAGISGGSTDDVEGVLVERSFDGAVGCAGAVGLDGVELDVGELVLWVTGVEVLGVLVVGGVVVPPPPPPPVGGGGVDVAAIV